MTAELDLTEATAALGRLALGANYAHDVQLLRLVLERLKALSSPPADDVREALARTLWEAAVRDNPEGVPAESWEELLADEPAWAEGYYAQADAAIAAFAVRPYGTVTDAFAEYVDHLGVDATEDHDGEWWDGYRQAQRDNTRHAAAALEAAREARS